jgi:glyoxylase-like metal-dependent hydrolase (beta-lactamase superfamily II)
LTIGFPAAAFGTNCYVLAPSAGEECLVVDPGIGVEEPLRAVLAEHRLRPAAVLLTHGHIDHVYSVTPVCGGQTAAYIHADDRYRLHDALSIANPGLLAMLADDVEWITPGPARLPTAGTWRGHAGVRRFFEILASHEDIQQFEPYQFVAQGGTVVVFVRAQSVITTSGRWRAAIVCRVS